MNPIQLVVNADLVKDLTDEQLIEVIAYRAIQDHMDDIKENIETIVDFDEYDEDDFVCTVEDILEAENEIIPPPFLKKIFNTLFKKEFKQLKALHCPNQVDMFELDDDLD